MFRAIHHQNLRKRIHEKKEQYPHPNKFKRIMDEFIYFIGIVMPIMTLPQIYKIWFEQNATGVSIISWTGYLICAIFWLIYGIIHQEKPIIISYIIWIILEILIVVGVIIYG